MEIIMSLSVFQLLCRTSVITEQLSTVGLHMVLNDLLNMNALLRTMLYHIPLLTACAISVL